MSEDPLSAGTPRDTYMDTITKIETETLDCLTKYFAGQMTTSRVLTLIHGSLMQNNKILEKMYELNNTHTIFNVLRHYLGKGNNMKFEEMDSVNQDVITIQSSLIQIIDTFLGIKHSTETSESLTKMNKHMSEKHLEFIKSAGEHRLDLTKIDEHYAKLREQCIQKWEHSITNDFENILPEESEANRDVIQKNIWFECWDIGEKKDIDIKLRDKCIDELAKFRSNQLVITNRHIAQFGSKIGSGETELLQFLNKAINDLTDSKYNKGFKENITFVTTFGISVCAMSAYYFLHALY